jgi:hypothetical protein
MVTLRIPDGMTSGFLGWSDLPLRTISENQKVDPEPSRVLGSIQASPPRSLAREREICWVASEQLVKLTSGRPYR